MNDYIKNMRKYVGHETIILAGASVFIHKDGNLLLHKRSDNGCWSDFGGGLEIGETLEDTAKRELLEESGLQANSLELIGVYSGVDLLYTYPNGDKVANVCAAYLCEDFSGELEISDESTDFKWFDIDDLPENISPPVKPVILDCVSKLKFKLKSKEFYN